MKDSSQQNKISGFKRFVNELVLVSLVLSAIMPVFLYPVEAKAEDFGTGEGAAGSVGSADATALSPGAVEVSDSWQTTVIKLLAAGKKKDKTLRDTVANAVYVASKEALSYMLNTMAFDIATWLASGDKGQQPMFMTQGWGAYLTDVADGAAGMFLENLSGDWLGFNICNPSSISLKINIGLGIARTRRPAKPDCSVTELVKNWDNFVNDPNFLQKFAPAFDPYGNDIGIAFSMFEKYDQTVNDAVNNAIRTRDEDQGAKGVVQRIAGDILTPSFLVREEAHEMLRKGTVADEKVTYGDIVLDAASTFINTLAGKLFERLFKEGLAALSGSDKDKKKKGFELPGFNFDLYSGDTGTTQFAGKQTAENRFKDILQVGAKKGRVYDVLSKLTVCSDAAKPGPEECVIKPEFRTAIERKLTLKEAIDQGFVSGEAPFGFMAYDASAIYRGYPFRSIQILRSYRVVPVGWELAALAINKNDPEKTFNLNRLIELYDDEASPYKGLIDENWVLTLPEHFCKAEGPGPKITNEELVGGTDANADGDFKDAGDIPPKRNVTRQDYCADYQSCLEKNPDGSCKYYGYCSEDKRIWDFGGTLCPEYFNTCETFQKSGDNKLVSYLANSLVFNNCSVDNAGCRWYCLAFNAVNNIWTCRAEGQKVLKPCAEPGGCPSSAACDIAEGQSACSDKIKNINLSISAPCGSGSKWWVGDKCAVSSDCTVLKGGVSCTNDACQAKANLLSNAGFETGAPLGNLAANWTGEAAYFRLVSGAAEKIYRGKNSIKFYNAGAPFAVGGAEVESIAFNSSPPVTGLKAGTKNYTFSGWVYNKLNSGAITINVGGVSKPVNPEIKNVWQEISFDFDGAASVSVSIAIAKSGNPVSGTAWFDGFRISEACVTNPVTLSLIGDYSQAQSKLHLDRDAADCPQDQAGCSQFIRTRAGLGTNLAANGGFEIADDNSELLAKNWLADSGLKAERVVASDAVKVKSGAYAMKFDAGGGGEFSLKTPIIFSEGRGYAASAWVYLDSDNLANISISLGTAAGSSETSHIGRKTKQWVRLYDIRTMPATVSDWQPKIIVSLATGSAYLDDFQVEEVAVGANYPSNYKEYGSANLTYLKKPPEFLGCRGLNYETEPGQCFDYALYCQPEEVGCENYTPVLGGPAIPGVTVLEDYCPAECLGYDAFSQSATMLESQTPLAYFIPQTALACGAANAGCDEFTNLDEVAKGGEGREYYQYLRQCKKPRETSSCRNFYAWQGSDEAGYQLKVYNFTSLDNKTPDKVITDYSTLPAEWCPSQDSTCCDGPEDLALNPFCRELLSIDGTVSYTIYLNTVTCSDDCHPYRKTRRGEDEGIAQSNCAASLGVWQNGACIYQAIPGQGISCPAAAAGCREYKGNTAGNLFTVFSDTFEGGTAFGWDNNNKISNEALAVAGHSLASKNKLVTTKVIHLSQVCSDAIQKCDGAHQVDCYDQNLVKCAAGTAGETCLVNVGQTSCGPISRAMMANKQYLLSFWAKSAGTSLNQIEVKLGSGQGDFGAANLGPEWDYYLLGPVKPTAIGPESFLQFSAAAGDFYLDNIRIQEIQDYTYVIKNSWKTPNSCDTNPWVDPPVVAPQFMLGCKQYQDSQARLHNLKSFDHLCRPEAVGCEALIDTFNYSSPFEKVFNIQNEISKVTVPADKIVYLTNRPDVSCSAENQGCQPLGLPDLGINEINKDLVSSFATVFKINNPDNYQKTLCASPEVGCEEYQSSGGFAYFKDPGNKTCEFRLPTGETEEQSYGWFKTGSVALLPDCPLVESPVGSLDYPAHPGAEGFAGICPAEFNTCTQFIDPVSEIAKNLVFNYDFKLDLNNDGKKDGWDQSADNKTLSQTIILKPYTLYTLAAEGKSPINVQISDCRGIASFDQSLILNAALSQDATAATLNLSGDQKYSGRFMTKSDVKCALKVNEIGAGLPAYVAVRETVFDYVLGSTVDKTGCNGAVDKEKNCVLFNDRSGVNYKNGETDTSYLAFDADLSGDNGLPVLCQDLNCDSNAVLKVRPDRTCETWLSCAANAEVAQKNGELKNYCLSLGLCNSNDEKGNCDNFVLADSSSKPDVPATPEMIKNLSGYIYTGLNPNKPGILEPFFTSYADMSQYGGTAKITNGDFEQTFGGRAEPVGWYAYNDNEGWQDKKFRVVVDGKNSIEGASYLRLNSLYQAVSEEIDIQRNQTYILTGWVNTLDLQDSGSSQEPKAQICIIKGKGTLECPEDLRKKAGLPWKYVSLEFNSGENDIIKIVLQNYSAGVNFCRNNPDTSCTLGGFSLFDMISLNSVLNLTLKTDDFAASDLESRSCRVFPKSSALSCRFNDAGTLYFGQYGYCVLKDPQNKDQCLQWWPVDQIQGEILEDLPNYSDRAPLYYCLKKDIKTIDISEVGGLARISEQAAGTEYAGFKSLDSGKEIRFVPFTVAAAYRPLFRWPYITKFEFTGVAGGMGAQSTIGALVIRARMEREKGCVVAVMLAAGGVSGIMPAAGCNANYGSQPNGDREYCHIWEPECLQSVGAKIKEVITDLLAALSIPFDLTWSDDDEWGGWGLQVVVIDKFPLVIVLPWHTAQAITFGSLMSIVTKISDFFKLDLISAGTIGMKIITDQDPEFAGVLPDPVPDMPGDILGAAWFVDSASDPGVYAAVLTGVFSGEFKVQYCSKLAQVVTSAGSNKGWANKLNEGSGYILKENVMDYSLADLTDSDDNNDVPSLKSNVKYKYENPFNYEKFLADPLNYQASDYRPFASLVPPDDAQLPSQWDSRTDTAYRQPLYYEPPREALGRPYQSRMGEVHSTDGLKKLFLKSYNVWEWSEMTSDLKSDDGYQELGNSAGWDLLEGWGLNDGYCASADGTRLGQDDLCRVRPIILESDIKVDGGPGIIIKRNKAVKLSFTVKVDPEQLPLKSYVIDWGDGETTSVYGATLRGRENTDNPFVFYHPYDYWQMVKQFAKEKAAGKKTNLCCDTDPECDLPENVCATKAMIKVKDNWNAESCRAAGNCLTTEGYKFVPLEGTIEVKLR